MNKNAIKKFAIEARKKLIASVSDRAGMLGITVEGCREPISKGMDFEVYKTVAGTEVTLNRNQCEQRRKLVEQINSRGFEAVVEEVAYTWFNRICAIRFMEVNDYLPTRVRVLSSEKEGKNEPDIVTQALDVDLWNTLDEQKQYESYDKEHILKLKADNKLDELFAFMFIKQCKKLGEILPGLFEPTEDYTELLFNISITNEDDVIRRLIVEVPEEDFDIKKSGQIEIIGWLYQYYITELNERVYDGNMSKNKVSKELLPAATQLFTPDWPIKYMVQNSLGKLFPDVAKNTGINWNYYLENSIEVSNTLNIEQVRVIDPCMGSGHILLALFDALMDIYVAYGYQKRDAAVCIINNNIYGIDIDKRAYQLAYFSLMMKGREYNRRIWEKVEKVNICYIEESNSANKKHIELMACGNPSAKGKLLKLYELFYDARELGSIIKVDADFDLTELGVAIDDIEMGQMSFDMIGINDTQEVMKKILVQLDILRNDYDVVITNPPYLGNSRYSKCLSDYVNTYYAEVKTDLSMIMFKKALVDFVKDGGYVSFITTSSWLNLKSFETIRKEVIKGFEFDSLVDFGTELFEGKVGHNPIVAWSVKKACPTNSSIGIRLVDYCYSRRDEKEREFFNRENYFVFNQREFLNIQGSPIAYFASEKLLELFKNPNMGEVAKPRQGLATGNNDKFTRMWYEVDFSHIKTDAKNREEALASGCKWFPYNKGGEYRKWYGNNEYVVNWSNDGYEIRNNYEDGKLKSRPQNMDFYFVSSITWSKISSGNISFRWKPCGNVFDVAGTSIFTDENQMYLLGFCNSCVAMKIAELLSPTLNYEVGHIASFPLIFDEEKKEDIELIVKENINIAKEEYDDYEISWDFKTHPLVRISKEKGITSLEKCFEEWIDFTQKRFLQLKKNEEKLNEYFIEIYGLKNEIEPTVEEKNISLRVANYEKDMKSFLSYIIGCILGRYSSEREGLLYSGGEENVFSSLEFKPDKDNIVLITDEEYSKEDIVGKIVDYIRYLFGNEELENNLQFIASGISKGSKVPRQAIRDYIINDFYGDHCSLYTSNVSGRRPIYWMFDSGKTNAFKALSYVHRFNDDTLGKVRIDYLHKVQMQIESALQSQVYIRDNSTNNTEKARATKLIEKYTKQLQEILLYDRAIAHAINLHIHIDIEDGVKVNYPKFQGIIVEEEGKKDKKINLLREMK